MKSKNSEELDKKNKAYAYIELRLMDANGWVYERKEGQTGFTRIGIESKILWERIHELTSEGWKIHSVYPLRYENPQKNYLAYLLELRPSSKDV